MGLHCTVDGSPLTIQEPDEAADEAFDLLAHFERIKAEQRAGDVGGIPFERAIGIAVAKGVDKSIRDVLVRNSYTLIGAN